VIAPPAVRVTPLVPCPALGRGAAEVALKLECLQRTGSFKLRGAVAKLASLEPAALARGVVASSAGNHGAGVALAARARGAAATVVVPRTTPANKRQRIAALGGAVVVAGDGYDEAEREARRLAAERGAVFVSPFDDEAVIAGNGDGLARELLAQQPAVRRVVCPVGGGGLIGGLARQLAPRGVSVVGVQPEANCAMFESLRRGAALTEYHGRPTLAEGCEGAVAERTFALVARHVAAIGLVEEPAIRRAVAFAYRRLGIVVECSAAVALAGLREGAVAAAEDGPTVVVVTGGNIEPELLDQILAEPDE
jgi:threonine dehydratase